MAGTLAAAGLAGLVAAVLWLRRRWVVAVVRGQSMTPTLADGRRVLARRVAAGRIRTGDVIVFRAPGVSLLPVSAENPAYRIKRVAAVSGDPRPCWLPGPPAPTVPPGHLVVLGDNPRSEDSRHYGPVPESSVLGVVRLRRLRQQSPGVIPQ